MLLDIFTFTGRLHPLIVHLPIGFLLLAVLFDVLSYTGRYASLRPAVPLILLAGFVAAVMACIFGYVLSLSGDYEAATLSRHQSSGIILAVIAGLLWLLTTQGAKRILTVPGKMFTGLLAGLLALVSYTGHQGGNLTHGHDYLTLATLTHKEREKPTTVDAAFIYEDVVQPMLVKKCSQCHRQGKLKGNLSVEDIDHLLKGGKAGPAVVAGKPNASELFKRISLDPAHEDFMPADGKPPLTKTETSIIRWWIEQAGAVTGTPIKDLKEKSVIQGQVAAYLGLEGAAPETPPSGVEQQINPAIPASLDMQLVEALRRKGLTVRVMLQHPVMLDVTLPAGSGKQIADIREDLLRVGPHIVWLNLSDNRLTENDLGFLKQLPNLEKLRLEKNPVGDGISDHIAGLKHLEAVNLNETRITKVCVNKLEGTGIKRLYTWHTAADGKIAAK